MQKKTPLSKDSKMIGNLGSMEQYSVVENQFDKHSFAFFCDLSTALGSKNRSNTFDYDYFFILFLDPIRRLRELDAESCDRMMRLLGWMLKNIDVSNAPPSYLENIKILATKYNVGFNKIIKSALREVYNISNGVEFNALMTILQNLVDADRLGIDLNNDGYRIGITYDANNTYTSLCHFIGEEKISGGKKKKAIERFYALPCTNKAIALKVLRILTSNVHSFEDALKLLEQRPNLIPVINFKVIAERGIPKFLLDIQAKTNEELGAAVSYLERFLRKEILSFSGTDVVHHERTFDAILFPETLPAGIIEFFYSLVPDKKGVVSNCQELSRKAWNFIDLFRQHKLSIQRLQALLEPISEISAERRKEGLRGSLLILEKLTDYDWELSDDHFKELTKAFEADENLYHCLMLLEAFTYKDKLDRPAFILFCLLPNKSKVIFFRVLKTLQEKGYKIVDSLKLFGTRPNLIPLVHRANELKLDLPLFLKNVEHHSDDELGAMVSYLERFALPVGQEFFRALVSVNGLDRPEIQTFLNSLPLPADEKLHGQAIDFVQAGIKYVDDKLLGRTKLAKFLEPIPEDCKEVSALIESRGNLFAANLWMHARMFSVRSRGQVLLHTPEEDMVEHIASFITPKSPAPENPKSGEVAGGDQEEDQDEMPDLLEL